MDCTSSELDLDALGRAGGSKVSRGGEEVRRSNGGEMGSAVSLTACGAETCCSMEGTSGGAVVGGDVVESGEAAKVKRTGQLEFEAVQTHKSNSHSAPLFF